MRGVHLIGAFDFEQTESQIDIDALAARYDDPDFWNRALVEAPDDSLTQPLDRTFTVLERWAFLSGIKPVVFPREPVWWAAQRQIFLLGRPAPESNCYGLA
jgi:hypothetical protein